MKTLRLFLTAMLLLTCNMMYAFEVDGISYSILSYTDKTVEVISSSSKYSGDIVIPEIVEYTGTIYSVTSIGSEAFNGCSNLTSIKLPKGVTCINDRTFTSCI